MVILVVLYAVPCGEACGLQTKGKAGIKTQHKATIVAVSIISFNRIVIFMLYDNLALKFRHPCSHLKVAALCEFSQRVYDTPRVLLISDSLAGSLSVLLFITAWMIQLLSFKLSVCTKRYQCENKFFQDLKYFPLILITLLFVFCCLMHTPYITMAYLSDAHYATSILVYYMTILFVEFGMVQFVLRICYNFRVPLILTENKCIRNLKLCALYSVIIILLISLILLLYGVVACVSLFYFYLPVNNAISDLPNEGLVVYQTAIILLGAYITYKALIRVQKKNKYLHTISRQVKENEIALLSTEIEYLTLEASEIKVEASDHEIEVEASEIVIKDQKKRRLNLKIENQKKRILLLRKEIQLEYILSNMMCLVDEPDSLINQRKVAHLYHQWKKVFYELEAELDNLRIETQPPFLLHVVHDSQTELNRLQNEFLHHLSQLHRLTEEQRRVDIKEDLDKILESNKVILKDDHLLSHPKNNSRGLTESDSTVSIAVHLDPIPAGHPTHSTTINPTSEGNTQSNPPTSTIVDSSPKGDADGSPSAAADGIGEPGPAVSKGSPPRPDAKQRKKKQAGHKSDLDDQRRPLLSRSDGGDIVELKEIRE
jgi:hypothetical protein